MRTEHVDGIRRQGGGGARARAVFDHLDALTDERGLIEHALRATPLPDHGYRVDDAARALVITCREPRPGAVVLRLNALYLEFVLAALAPDGTSHARMGPDGLWRDEPGLGDAWGRTVWGLGVASAESPEVGQRDRALSGFRLAARHRSTSSRPMVFAALGAGAVLRSHPGELDARTLLRDAVDTIDAPAVPPGSPWPGAGLRYTNASVPEALLVAGDALRLKAVVERGLKLLAFLFSVEIRGKHLSVALTDGGGFAESVPRFDQQPAEVAALADACATAYRITRDPRWLTGINLAWRWFLGANDRDVPMFDAATGAGFDGLQATGASGNRGAESTLAMLSTAQQARRVQELR